MTGTSAWGGRFQSRQGLSLPQEDSGTQPPPSMDVDSEDEEEEEDLPEYPNLEGIDSQSLANAANRSSAYSTPHRPNTSQNFPADKSLKDQGKAIMRELEQFPITAEYYVANLYKDVVKDRKKILKFIGKSPLFQNNAWKLDLPSDPSKLREAMLYPPFKDIIAAILAAFVTGHDAKLPAGVDRQVHDTHNIQLRHKEGHHSSPDLSIYAAGPSFENTGNGASLSYASLATVIDLKRDRDMTKSVNIEQLSVYIRYVCLHPSHTGFMDLTFLVFEGRSWLTSRTENMFDALCSARSMPALFTSTDPGFRSRLSLTFITMSALSSA